MILILLTMIGAIILLVELNPMPIFFSPEEYLNLEANSPMRHEYRSGLVYAMAGISERFLARRTAANQEKSG